MNWRSVVAILFVSFLLLPACQKTCKQGEDAECWISALKDPELAEKAIDNLKQIGDKKAEPALIEVFNESAKNPEFREKIAEIFKRWGTVFVLKHDFISVVLDIVVGKHSKKSNIDSSGSATKIIGCIVGKECI